MGFFSLSRKRAGNLRFVFDFGSGSVGCAVVTLRGGGQKPYVHFTTRVDIATKEQLDYDRFTSATFSAFAEAAEQAKRYLSKTHGDVSINGVVVVLSAPWYASRTHAITHTDTEGFSVSSSLIQEVLDAQDVQKTKDEADILTQKHIADPAIFERRILDISLNGYKVKKPLGKKATRMDISVFSAVISLAFYQKLQKVVQEQFNECDLALHSHVLSVFTTVRDCFGSQGDFLLVDISREVTEIALSLNDVLENTISIPVGTTTVLQRIAKAKNGTEQEALSLITLAGKKTQALDHESTEGGIVEEEAQAWRLHFTNALEKLIGTKAYPRNIFLTAPSSTLDWFEHTLEHVHEEHNADASAFEVTPLLSCLTQNLVDMDTKADVDSMLALETLHISRL